jgi:acyl carrier protein
MNVGQTLSDSDLSAEAIEDWVIHRIARLLGVQPHEISATEALTDLGLESVEAFTLSGELSDLLGLKLSPTLAWDLPTIADLAQHLEHKKKSQD